MGALVFFGLAPHVFAQGFVPLTNIPGLTSGAVADTTGLANFLNNLYKYLIGLAAILAVIEIIWGGLEISTQDSVSKKSDGKERITQAILGLILVLSPVLVFSIINPSILNLSLNLPELKTMSGTPIGLGEGVIGQPAVAPVLNVGGCSQVTGPIPGSLLINCKAATADAAIDATTEYKKVNCVGGMSEDFAPFFDSNACTGNTTTVDNSGGGSTVTTSCNQYAIQSYCSPIVTVKEVDKQIVTGTVAGTVSVVNSTIGYLDGGNTVSACKSTPRWTVRKGVAGDVRTSFSGVVTIGTEYPCPTDDPIYKSLILNNGAGNYKCFSVKIYCAYTP